MHPDLSTISLVVSYTGVQLPIQYDTRSVLGQLRCKLSPPPLAYLCIHITDPACGSGQAGTYTSIKGRGLQPDYLYHAFQSTNLFKPYTSIPYLPTLPTYLPTYSTYLPTYLLPTLPGCQPLFNPLKQYHSDISIPLIGIPNASLTALLTLPIVIRPSLFSALGYADCLCTLI